MQYKTKHVEIPRQNCNISQFKKKMVTLENVYNNSSQYGKMKKIKNKKNKKENRFERN